MFPLLLYGCAQVVACSIFALHASGQKPRLIGDAPHESGGCLGSRSCCAGPVLFYGTRQNAAVVVRLLRQPAKSKFTVQKKQCKMFLL